MSFHLLFGKLTDSGFVSFIKEHDIPPFSQYSNRVFQPLISSDGHDEIYILIVRLPHKMRIFREATLILTTQILKKISTSTPSNSCLTLASLNIRSVSRHVGTFQMDINKLKYNILGLPDLVSHQILKCYIIYLPLTCLQAIEDFRWWRFTLCERYFQCK